MSERIHSDLPEFNVFISERLKKMLSEFDGTREQFAKKAEISRSTLTRYLNGHCRKRIPAAKNMLHFVSRNKGEYHSLLFHYFPDEAEDFKTIYVDADSDLVHPRALSYIEDDEAYYGIFSHSGLDYGMPLETIHSTWGKSGIKKGQKLVDDGLLDLESKRLVRRNKSASYGNLDTVKKVAEYNVREFSLDNIYNEQGGMGVLLNNLNDDGIRAARKCYLKHIAEFSELFSNPKYRGTTPFSYCVVTGKTSCSEDYEKDVQEIIEDEEKKNED